MIEISLVVPMNNEEEIVDELIFRSKKVLEQKGKSYEIILVDDGSTDDTWLAIEKISKNENRVKGIKLARNFGQHKAITAGLKVATGEWTVVMDGDLQDRPEVIGDLIDATKSGYEVVFVSRQERPESKSYLYAQNIFYKLLNLLSGLNMDRTQANFSIISETVRIAFLSLPEQARFYSSTISWLGFKKLTIYAAHGSRKSGNTSYSIKSRIKLALDIIFSYSNRPLVIGTTLGISLTILSIIILIVVLLRYYIFGFSVIGWTSIIITLVFSTGVIVFMIGILGLYIGRIFDEVKGRPLYIIEKRTQNKSE